MLGLSSKSKILLAVDPIDFRKGVDSIVRLCQHQLELSPFDEQFFIFRNKRKTDIKVLYYDGQGFCLFHKRLSVGRFLHWPTVKTNLIHLSETQLRVLIANGNPLAIQEQPNWR